MSKDTLITGGTGRLGTELKKVLDAIYVGIEDYDITYPFPKGDYDLIVHMAAYTNVVKAEEESHKCFATNVLGTWNIVRTYKDVPIIYISTEYAQHPLGVYAHTKRYAEEIVKSHPKHLILRTSFKPNPWPFDFAYEDQWTQGDYVDVIAMKLAEKIKTWDRQTSSMQYLGTGRKTILELAKRTKPNVIPNKVSDYKYRHLIPYDYQD